MKLHSREWGNLIPATILALSTLSSTASAADPPRIETPPIAPKFQSLLNKLGVGNNKDCLKAWNPNHPDLPGIIQDPEKLQKFIRDEYLLGKLFLDIYLDDTNPETGEKGYLGDKFVSRTDHLPPADYVEERYEVAEQNGKASELERVLGEMAEANRKCNTAMGYRPDLSPWHKERAIRKDIPRDPTKPF